ncbi:hypothetical protein XENOCAPTIV_002638, partial [Xenoophorus captivus]
MDRGIPVFPCPLYYVFLIDAFVDAYNNRTETLGWFWPQTAVHLLQLQIKGTGISSCFFEQHNYKEPDLVSLHSLRDANNMEVLCLEHEIKLPSSCQVAIAIFSFSLTSWDFSSRNFCVATLPSILDSLSESNLSECVAVAVSTAKMLEWGVAVSDNIWIEDRVGTTAMFKEMVSISVGFTISIYNVHDGNSSSTPELTRLCGTELPSPINSSSNQLYIKLRTDGSVNAGGFIASYNSMCHNIFFSHQHQGVIESLNFPNSYPGNSLCSWTIQASSGNTINYTFTAFQLEATSSCNYDYIKLYNGPNEQAPLIGAFCGNTPPAASSTTSSALTLVFRTDSSISMSGFQMMWYQNGCGGNIGGPSGSISSPGYPNRYPENRECIWYVTSTPGSSITLNILEFDVEFHENCNYDVLEVYGGPDLQAPRLARLCSTTSSPMQVSSTGNLLTVRFKSDAYVSGRGFNANWAEVQGG